MTRFLYEVPVVAATATTGTYLAKVGTCAASRGPGSRLVGDPLHGDGMSGQAGFPAGIRGIHWLGRPHQ